MVLYTIYDRTTVTSLVSTNRLCATVVKIENVLESHKYLQLSEGFTRNQPEHHPKSSLLDLDVRTIRFPSSDSSQGCYNRAYGNGHGDRVDGSRPYGMEADTLGWLSIRAKSALEIFA